MRAQFRVHDKLCLRTICHMLLQKLACVPLTFGLLLAAQAPPSRTNDGPFRLQYHFTPPQNWTNDPNGLVYYKGEYHLFYQFNPFGAKWGHMSWGHAVSRDLVHWQDLPVALEEKNGIMIFSGSAVVDAQNSSGLCTAHDSDRSCLIVIYTGHTAERQTQNIAFSNDRGRTWTKYKHNPVIDLGLKNFRDPKVMWYAPGRKWVMTAALPDQHKVRFFESRDLIHWKALSDFGPAGATGGVWECPDLFELPVAGGGARWVLIVNINPGAIAGGSGTPYFIGKFDGSRFVNENKSSKALWLDHGKDYYAAVSYFDHKPRDDRRIMIGWFSNWQYANDTPETGWRGAMALPREVALTQTEQGIRVLQRPVRELEQLRQALPRAMTIPAASAKPMTLDEAARLLDAAGDGKSVELEITFLPGEARRYGMRILGQGQNGTLVGIDHDTNEIYIDRTRSGNVGFSKTFPGKQTAPLPPGTTVKLHLFIDRSSIEVFVDGGAVVLADRIYPGPNDTGLSFFAGDKKPRVVSLKLWRMQSIWAHPAQLEHGGSAIRLNR
jgi:sucrose-6-phosphate hydrolase SacC (GH32 family)